MTFQRYLAVPKRHRYQDYVIADGKLVGDFEAMYRDFDDPWEQTTREEFASEKAVALNLLGQLKAQRGCRRVLELGCGFGDFSARATALGYEVVGMDISETAVKKAQARHPETHFLVGALSDHRLIRDQNPDVIVMAEITWYVLEQLPDFIAFLKRDMPNIYLIHLLMTYAPGIQKYGREWFTNLAEIKAYFGFDYLESGLVHYDGGARTWFLGRPPTVS